MQNSQGCFGIPKKEGQPRSHIIRSDSGTHYDAINGFIRVYDTPVFSSGSAIRYVSNPTIGDYFEITEAGLYTIDRVESVNASVILTLILNGSTADLALDPINITTNYASGPGCLIATTGNSTLTSCQLHFTGWFLPGDIIRAMDSSNQVSFQSLPQHRISICKISA